MAGLDRSRSAEKNPVARRWCTVPKYLLAATLTQGGVQGVMTEGGTTRREAVQKTAESVGGTLEGFYFAFGATDVYVIVDVPDAASAAAVSMATTASGAVRVNTTVLITPEEMDEVRTKSVEYRPPGG
jgi:uncharacterized protein with GYD domain